MSALDGFNRVARYYDPLKRIVFGRSIDDCQVHFLNALPEEGNILILGGGSGDLLEALLETRPGCSIWYVEASSEMIHLATNRVRHETRPRVSFVHATEETIPSEVRFDGAIANFFLDLFPDDVIAGICRKVSGQLNAGGVWLVSDFVNQGRWWQRLLLRMMYRFFVTTCSIEARQLPAWEDRIRNSGLQETESQFFYKGFIKSCVYRKPAP